MRLRTWIMASALAVVLPANGLRAQAPKTTPAGKIVAKVNGEDIEAADVDRDVALLARERFKFHPPTEPQRRTLRSEVLQNLVDDTLVRQFMDRGGIKVPPAEVVREMTDLETKLRKQSRTLAEYCKESGQTEMQLRATIQNMLRWAAYVKPRTGEADVKRYYDENKEFFDQVMVRASHILIRLGPTASAGERQAGQQKLEALKAEIAAGKIEFAEAAKKHSQCSSAPNGGDLGFFSRKWMVDETIAKTAFALPVGGVSNVVQTEVGLHLLLVTDRKKGEPTEYEKVKDEVRLYLMEELRQEVLAKERKTAKVEIVP